MLEPVNGDELPNVQDAVRLYEDMYDGRLTVDTPFGTDPLDAYDDLKMLRQSEFERLHPINQVFGECVNDKPRLFQNAIVWYYEKTIELMTL